MHTGLHLVVSPDVSVEKAHRMAETVRHRVHKETDGDCNLIQVEPPRRGAAVRLMTNRLKFDSLIFRKVLVSRQAIVFWVEPGSIAKWRKHKKKHEAAEAAAASGKMSRKEFEKELAKLQVELVRLQTWVQAKRARIIVVFEGRDTAGKGGVISRITARTSPRVYRHVALPAPSDREKTQVYLQRYMAQFPAAGEIILFDRSWYNRAGVERVMGFCTDEQYERFPGAGPRCRAGNDRQERHYPAQVLSRC